MRVWHLIFAVILAALVLKITEVPAGRVAVVVFVTGLGLITFGCVGLLALFRSIGAIGAARDGRGRAEALLSTLFVLAMAAGAMAGVLAIGSRLVHVIVG